MAKRIIAAIVLSATANAIDEAAREREVEVLSLPTGQGIIMKGI